MDRRAFFRFACGGVCAAPAAVLVGEQASGQVMPDTQIGVSMETDGKIRAYCESQVRLALAIYEREVLPARIADFNSQPYRRG